MNMLEYWDKYAEYRKCGVSHKTALSAVEELEKDLPKTIQSISKILQINPQQARQQIMNGCGKIER